MTLKTSAAAIALALALAAGQAHAQDAGATVIGNDGAPLGAIASNDGTTVMLDTGKHQVPLGPESFAQREGSWTLNTTKAELDAMMDEAVAQREAALAAALVVGAEVATADAQPLGTIETLADDGITLVQEGEKMILPNNMFALDADGGVMVLANHADIMAALNAVQS